jgi:hypothetical protein
VVAVIKVDQSNNWMQMQQSSPHLNLLKRHSKRLEWLELTSREFVKVKEKQPGGLNGYIVTNNAIHNNIHCQCMLD